MLAQLWGKNAVWLFKIERGSEVGYYSAGARDIVTAIGKPDATFAAETTWISQAVSSGRLRQTAALARAQNEITLPISDPLAQLFLSGAGRLSPKVTIWHGYANDPDGEFVPKFRGRVVSVQMSRTKVTLVCEAGFTAARAKAFAAVMQRPCRHAHYGSGCGVSLAAFEIAGSAAAVVGATVTVAAAAAQPDGYYSLGILRFGAELHFIIEHIGSSLRLLEKPGALAAAIAGSGAKPVLIAPGCDLSEATCTARFANIDNYGGFSRMSESPFDGRSIG